MHRRVDEKPVTGTCRCLLIAILMAAGVRGQQGAEAPDPRATPEETVLLELINRFRADPAAEAARLAAAEPPRAPHPELDWEMFRAEVEALEPAPPLVFNPRLILAARNHAAYLVKNGTYNHDEIEGKEGYSGATGAARARFAGYGDGARESLVGRTKEPWAAYWGAIVDDGPGGAGGMQDGRGHRVAAHSPSSRELGSGFIAREDGTFAAVWLVGNADRARRAGGVCYVDLDGDGFYDAGEGVGGVRIEASTKETATSWPSGAFVLPIASKKSVELKARFRGLLVKARFPAGEQNLRFEVALRAPLQKEIERELTKLARAGRPDSNTARKIRANLYLLGEGVPLPPELRPRIDEAVGPLAEELQAQRREIIDGLATLEDRDFRKILSAARRSWRGSLADAWFVEADRLAAFRREVMKLEHQASRGLVPRKPLHKTQALAEKLASEVTAPDLAPTYAELTARLAELARGSGQDR